MYKFVVVQCPMDLRSYIYKNPLEPAGLLERRRASCCARFVVFAVTGGLVTFLAVTYTADELPPGFPFSKTQIFCKSK